MPNKKLKVGNVPNLRFPGFTEEWETKKLADINIINPKNENLPFSFIYIDLESVVNGRLLKEERILKDEAPSRAQRRLTKGDILFQMVRPYQKNNLYFDKEGDYVASTGYAQIRTLQNSQFVFQYLHNQKFVDKVIERCTGTSYPAINSSDLGNIKIHYPNSPEQNKIANFLELLDNRIQTQNKIIEGLKLSKQTIIKKIFSKELRFKNDDEINYPDWQIKKLGEITLPVSKRNKSNEKLPVYSINNRLGFVPQNEQFEGINSDDRGYDITLYKVIDKYTFAYNPARINVGSIGYSRDLENIIISSLYVCFVTNEYVDDNFLFQYLKTGKFNKEVLKNVEGGVRDYLFYENFARIIFEMPCIEEQNKIADFLCTFDNKIDMETDYLKKLEEQKKYLLQNMFV
ncbi:restriction endonuclease subunit S [Flavobacterium sp. T12S277]|uniref:restriction endonuclease subunit S n=1 Tax=Flavobacterium sp. T12S277 TaxID=3402752 RepID=UPI003ADE612A